MISLLQSCPSTKHTAEGVTTFKSESDQVIKHKFKLFNVFPPNQELNTKFLPEPTTPFMICPLPNFPAFFLILRSSFQPSQDHCLCCLPPGTLFLQICTWLSPFQSPDPGSNDTPERLSLDTQFKQPSSHALSYYLILILSIAMLSLSAISIVY